MATASKNPKGNAPKPGSMTPLTATIKAGGSMIDPRMAPCGTNTIASPDDDGDEY